jgi:hypothetical protein
MTDHQGYAPKTVTLRLNRKSVLSWARGSTPAERSGAGFGRREG